MTNSNTAPPAPCREGNSPHPLALRGRAAAAALGISLRTLRKLTAENRIPHVRLGGAVIYPIAELERWLAEQAMNGGSR